MINWNWRTKLKTNKTFTKWLKKRIKYGKNKDQNWNINNKNDQPVIFKRKKRKEKKNLSATN
jgi:hypothetical protein